MRCSRRNCNHVLEDFEMTRKFLDGSYVDACTYCVPFDPRTQTGNHALRVPSRVAYNANEGDSPMRSGKGGVDNAFDTWYFEDPTDGDDDA